LGNAVAVGMMAFIVEYCLNAWWETVRDEQLLQLGVDPLPIHVANYFRYIVMMSSLPERCDEPLFVLAAHHKSGSTLGKKLAKASRSVLGHEVTVTMWIRHWRNFSCSAMRYYGCMDREAYRLLRSSGRPYKMVHFVRDPMKLVISAYWYHLREHDVQFVPGTGPRVLGALGTAEGLELEAAAELRSTLQEIREVVEDSSSDPHVLTIGLEDFYDNFNETTMRIFGFLLGPDHPALGNLLAAAVAVSDPSVPHYDILGPLENRDNPLEHRQRATDLIKRSKSPVWDQVRALRPAFGYSEAAPGRFRREPRPPATPPVTP